MGQALLDSSSGPDGLTLAENAHRNGVPPSTLHHRLHGCPTRRGGHVSQQMMSGEEEGALVQALLHLIKQGFPPTLRLLRLIAHSIVEARGQAAVPEIGKN